jgi:flagellar basal body P-ring formation protein FlgA
LNHPAREPVPTTSRPHLRLRQQAAAPLLAAVFAVSGAALSAPLSGEAGAVVQSFLIQQGAGLNGLVSVSADEPASGALPPCAALQPFVPPGVTAWGRFSLGVHCQDEKPWTRYISARLAVEGTYLAAARTIQAGQPLAPDDFVERSGDLTRLPRTVITQPSQLAGMVAVNSIAAGAPVRREHLKGVLVIQPGQAVRLLAQGVGFVASAEGKALTSAPAGGTIQVKTMEGRLLTGVARPDGQVTIAR